MKKKVKSVLSQGHTFKNVNSISVGVNITANAIVEYCERTFGIKLSDIDTYTFTDDDLKEIVQRILSEYLKTEFFVIEKIRKPDNYLNTLVDSGFVPKMPLEVEFYFAFPSNKDVNLYKLKNPDLFQEFFSERLRLINMLMK